MNQERLIEIVKEAQSKGYDDIKMKDVLYLVLTLSLGYDSLFVYRSLIDKDANGAIVDSYERMDSISYLSSVLESLVPKKITSDIKDLTFDENKAEMIALLEKIKIGVEDGTISQKDGIKLETEIRTKLNDKFETSKETEDQVIHVLTKFNTVCPHTRKECYIATKDDLIKKYDLVDRKELEKKYTLIPK